MLGGSLGLVEAGEGAVVTLVQPPSLAHGQVRLANLLQDLNVERIKMEKHFNMFKLNYTFWRVVWALVRSEVWARSKV